MLLSGQEVARVALIGLDPVFLVPGDVYKVKKKNLF
jgi:hypothetical protein